MALAMGTAGANMAADAATKQYEQLEAEVDDDNFQRIKDPKAAKSKDGCCAKMIKKCFFRMYPSHLKKTWTR